MGRDPGVVPVATKLYWLLRVGVALEYIGHGWAGLTRPPAWLPYYGLFGISEDLAHDRLTVAVGVLDVVVGTLILVWPVRVLLLHATAWGLFTALLRPAAGEGWWEFLERGGNFAMPLALLILVGWGGWSLRRWLERADAPAAVSDRTWLGVHWAARAGLALLLVGHGGFGAFENKAYWYDCFEYCGVGAATVDSANLMVIFGLFEIGLGFAVLVRPLPALLWFILFWKLGTELLRPLVGQEWFQFVERAGDYVLPLVLIFGAGLMYAARHSGRRDR